jgi:hypothetical protein
MELAFRSCLKPHVANMHFTNGTFVLQNNDVNANIKKFRFKLKTSTPRCQLRTA